MSGIGKEAVLDGILTRALDTGSVQLRTDGTKARLNKLGERVDALIVSVNLGIPELIGVALGQPALVGGTVYPVAAATVWVGVTTA